MYHIYSRLKNTYLNLFTMAMQINDLNIQAAFLDGNLRGEERREFLDLLVDSPQTMLELDLAAEILREWKKDCIWAIDEFR